MGSNFSIEVLNRRQLDLRTEVNLKRYGVERLPNSEPVSSERIFVSFFAGSFRLENRKIVRQKLLKNHAFLSISPSHKFQT